MPMKKKLNILFYTTSQPVPIRGGVERATITTACILQSYGHAVYSLFHRSASNHTNNCFEEECCLNDHDVVSQIADFLKARKIDVIIIQTAFSMVKAFKKATSVFPCKIISVYHFEPIWDKQFINFGRIYFGFRNNRSIRNFLRLIGFPLLRARHLINCYVTFRQCYRYSDRIVLLSEGYTAAFLKYVGGKDKRKIDIIANAMPCDLPDYTLKSQEKEKLVLIVSRLDEKQKRISLALDLWSEISARETSKDWSLEIVGDGEARLKYENYIRKHHLKNVSLEGRQEPWDYYKRASIFMMTSRSEGWGITLLEAQKFGVVPVCFNTFAAASDVVSDKCSGFLIDERDKQGYMKAVLSLMSDVELRDKMAQAGIEYVQRFSQDSVGAKWNSLVYSVLDK